MNVRRALRLLTLVTAGLCASEAAWIHLKAQLAQLLIAHAWGRVERGAGSARPWPWADTAPLARLTVPGRESHPLFVLEGASGRNLAFGPVHDPASVPPGERGNSVISGHRDTSFRFLESMKTGDRIATERAGRVTWFVVTDIRVVDSRSTRITLASDAPRLTLVTCYPFDAIAPGGPLRWVVTAEAMATTPGSI